MLFFSFQSTVLCIFLIISYTSWISGDETESEKLCEKCKCSNENYLVTIDCSDKSIEWSSQKLTEAISKNTITAETSLVLILHNNDISRLQQFPNVTINNIDVSIVKCNLIEIDDSVFKNMKTVRYLKLGHNKLTGDAVRGDIFRGPFNVNEFEPINLEILNLEYNLIHSLTRKMFIHLPNLKSLYLNNNPFKVIDAVTNLALSSIKNLEVLDMSETGLSTIPDNIFNNMKRLKQLFLSGNKFVTVPESVGSLGSSLELLVFNNNNFEELTDNSFLGLWRLDTLEIGENKKLEIIKAGAFIQLVSLRKLFLCNNPNLQYIDREAFRELKAIWPIREIYLNNNNLRSLPEDLAPWENLTTLNLGNNPWECDCEMISNMTKLGIIGKLSDSSDTRCAAPLRASGRELRTINVDEICKTGRYPAFKANGFASYARPSNILISFSVVVIVVFVGIIVGMRIKRCRMRRREFLTESVRYANING